MRTTRRQPASSQRDARASSLRTGIAFWIVKQALFAWREPADASVDEKHVVRGDARREQIEEAIDPSYLGEIDHHSHHVLANRRLRLVQLRLVGTRYRHASTLAVEASRFREVNSTVSARHNRYLAFKPFHLALPLRGLQL